MPWSLQKAVRAGLAKAGVYHDDRDWMAEIVSRVVAEQLGEGEASRELAEVIRSGAAEVSYDLSASASARIAATVRRFLVER